MAIEQAEQYLSVEGRALERALHQGGDGLRELAKFQNADGGFGHGLEPDIRSEDSSVIVTTIAFQHFRATAAPADEPVVVKACAYLRATYDAPSMDWPSVPDAIHSAPHAPWWNDAGVHSRANPRAEIVGYLYDYAMHFPADMRDALTQSALQDLQAAPDDLEMHDALCYLRLYATPSLPAAIQNAMTPHLTRILKTIVSTDPASWQAYGLQPLSVIDSPASPFAPLFADSIPANLDFLVAQQNVDGSWSPTWSWADISADGWAQAERDWRSVLTLDHVRKLRAFGRG